MHECRRCEENINNPLCPDCLSEGVAAWAGEKVGEYVVEDIFQLTPALRAPMGLQCIKCPQVLDICGHCYGVEMMEVLRHHPALAKQVREFVEFDKLPEKAQKYENPLKTFIN